MKQRQISLLSAIFININIIIGAGLFINPRPLTQLMGGWGFVSYLAGSALILPLVYSLSQIARLHPTSGGLYVYSDKYLTPFAGFVSGWGYFLGKTTSSGLLAYKFMQFAQTVVPALSVIPAVALAIMLLFSLALANIAGVSIGGKAQWLFIFLKAIPIGTVILFGLPYLLGPTSSFAAPAITNFPVTLPIALYALLGFEATCSIAHLIENPKKNVGRAIIISSLTVAGIAALFQLTMFLVVGQHLTQSEVPLIAYALRAFAGYPVVGQVLNAFVFSSIIGGSFGMLTSNSWNLFTLAKNNHLPFKKFLTRVTKTNVPSGAILLEAALSSLILLISVRQIALQNMAVFGMFISYFLSVISAYLALSMAKKMHPAIPVLAGIGCLGIIALCTHKILSAGFSYSFLVLMIIGIGCALAKKHKVIA